MSTYAVWDTASCLHAIYMQQREEIPNATHMHITKGLTVSSIFNQDCFQCTICKRFSDRAIYQGITYYILPLASDWLVGFSAKLRTGEMWY